MKNMRRNAAISALTLSLVAGMSHAHDGMHGPGGKYDQDEDASLSLAEYTVYLKDNKQDPSTAKARFTALDANKDGKLSSAEFIHGLVSGKTK